MVMFDFGPSSRKIRPGIWVQFQANDSLCDGNKDIELILKEHMARYVHALCNSLGVSGK